MYPCGRDGADVLRLRGRVVVEPVRASAVTTTAGRNMPASEPAGGSQVDHDVT